MGEELASVLNDNMAADVPNVRTNKAIKDLVKIPHLSAAI